MTAITDSNYALLLLKMGTGFFKTVDGMRL